MIRTGRPELYPEIADELLVRGARDEEHLRTLRALGFKSALIVPLRARGGTLGALTLVQAESGHRYGEEDVRFVQDLARRAAMAIDNARMYTREHQTVVALQQSLLPRRLPQLTGFEFAARYLPATSELDIGGDWYDGMLIGEGRLGLVIGDVAGHGLEAAATMGQFRNALRAYAFNSRDPVAVLERLNDLVRSGFSETEMRRSSTGSSTSASARSASSGRAIRRRSCAKPAVA